MNNPQECPANPTHNADYVYPNGPHLWAPMVTVTENRLGLHGITSSRQQVRRVYCQHCLEERTLAQ